LHLIMVSYRLILYETRLVKLRALQEKNDVDIGGILKSKSVFLLRVIICCIMIVLSNKELFSAPVFSDLAADTSTIIFRAKPDTLAIGILRHYMTWQYNAMKCLILFDTSLSAGFAAAPGEIDERLAQYNIAFPGIEINQDDIEKEIVIEKYLLQKINIIPISVEIDACYQDYKNKSPLKQPAEQKLIMSILNSRALFSIDEAMKLCKKMQEKKYEKDNLIMKEKKYWEVEELIIDDDPKNCLVIGPESDSCVVTVEEFNCFAALSKIRKTVEFKMVREMLLNRILANKYFSVQAHNKGINEKSDFSEKQKQQIEKSILLKNCSDTLLSKNDSLLTITYKKYYNRFFRFL